MIELNLKLLSNTTKKTAFLQTDTIEDIYTYVYNLCQWTPDKYFLRSNSKDISNLYEINGQLHIIPRLRGGKGGFGSMLRAIGAQIEKTTNREACRDLSGRRLRDINEEQRLKKWISQQAERDRENQERRKKKLEKLSSEPKHEFKDETYFAERSELPEKINDAFEQGLLASTSSVKRKVEDKEKVVKKKKKFLVDIDEFSSSDDTEENSESDRSLIIDEDDTSCDNAKVQSEDADATETISSTSIKNPEDIESDLKPTNLNLQNLSSSIEPSEIVEK